MEKTETLKTLILDDEIGMCIAAERVLKVFETSANEIEAKILFEPTYVNSVNDFNKKFESNNYNIILLDHKLPDGSGLDLIHKIKEKNPEVIIIMITAYATFETAVQATKEGAYDFLAKPFTPEELRYSIKKAAIQYLLAKRAKEFEEEKRKIRFEFISVLSHELKAPISAVEGYLSILKSDYKTLADNDYQNMVDRSLIRLNGMKKLIYDILDLTRIESGTKKRELIKIDIVQIIKSSIELLRFEAADNSITIELLNSDPIFFNADKNEIEIVFNNLISNAIKYNKPGGSVNINLKKTDKYLEIVVADTGIGIAETDLNRLFNDFVRIKNDKTMHIQGSGLGLSTLKKIAELYQGEIKVTSQLGEGTTFNMLLFETVE